VTDPSPPVVLLSERLGPPGPEELRLQRYGASVIGAPLRTRDEIVRNAAAATLVILGAVEPFDREAMAALPRLQAVVRRGVGHDNVDVDAATSLGILVANVPDASVDEVAEHALVLLLTLERRIGYLDRAVRSGLWRDDPARLQAERVRCRPLHMLTLGVVGLGRIGHGLVRRGRGIYREVLAADPVVTEDVARAAGVRLVALPELLHQSDHVSLHAPLARDAAFLVGERELSLLRPGAVLVNTARGGLLDEDAVLRALRSGRLAGAGLDVTAREPVPAGDPLLGVTDGLLLTGHSAAWSAASVEQLARRSVDAAAALLAGRRPASTVNPEVLHAPELRLAALRPAPA
jgi:D-3-phosphoglycerate dehydrogenase / 2-oxoglutarate reductase